MSVNFDHNRQDRIGIPEAILAGPKTSKDLELAIKEALKRNSSVLVTRIKPNQVGILNDIFEENRITFDPYHRTAIIGEPPKLETLPQTAILSGGTSDQPVVEEIRMSLLYFGINSTTYPDIGVAGIHRHQDALAEIANDKEIKILIVVAGNEGALFTVIAAQTSLPVVAVPTSIGYGFGGKGKASLQSALQTCSPGVVTVNIDNGFGAAAFVKKLFRV